MKHSILILACMIVATAGCQSTKKSKSRPEYVPEIKNVSFYDHEIKVPINISNKILFRKKVRPKDIQAQWDIIASTVSQLAMDTLLGNQERLNLNGWAFASVTRRLGRALYPRSDNTRAIFECYVMRKAGYDVRLAYNDSNVYLMLSSDDVVYDLPQLRLSGQRYYILLGGYKTKMLDGIRFYEGPYPEAQAPVDFAISRTPYLSDSTDSRTIEFTFRGTDHEIDVEYLSGSIHFFEEYFSVPMDLYFRSGASEIATTALKNELLPIMQDLSTKESVNLLLRFVQRGFDYKLDKKQFGEERWFYPEETLSYSYADCEDRSFFFAYLVRELLDLQIIGLRYPNHVATAVRLDDAEGKSVTYDGDRYYVADPTYFGADAGMLTSQVNEAEVEVIPIEE